MRGWLEVRNGGGGRSCDIDGGGLVGVPINNPKAFIDEEISTQRRRTRNPNSDTAVVHLSLSYPLSLCVSQSPAPSRTEWWKHVDGTRDGSLG